MVEENNKKTQGERIADLEMRLDAVETWRTQFENLVLEQLGNMESGLGGIKDQLIAQAAETENLKTTVGNISTVVVARLNSAAARPTNPSNGGRGPLFGGRGRMGPVQVRDTATGVVYRSKTEAGKALAPGLNLDPTNNFVYYQVKAQMGDRLEEVYSS